MTEPDFLPEDPRLDADARDVEAPAEDALEQNILADPAQSADDLPTEVHRDPEVDEWDALEQARVVDVDDDYR
jgi:hypothetical protein